MKISDISNIPIHEENFKHIHVAKKVCYEDETRLKELCNQFEQILVKNLVDKMHSSAVSFGEEKSREYLIYGKTCSIMRLQKRSQVLTF
jgi:hypothetical protein